MIFIVDQSGSMHGHGNTTVIEAMLLFLKSLSSYQKFSIICYGDDYEWLEIDGTNQLRNTPETEGKIIAAIKKFSASMGGTNIFDPLQEALGVAGKKTIFLLTDGDDPSNSEDI